ncbi:SPW repeat domain-containing protein [Natrialba aegyptia]
MDRSRMASMGSSESATPTSPTAKSVAPIVVRTAGATAVVGLLLLASSIVVTITGLLNLHNVLLGAVIATLGSVNALLSDTYQSPNIALTLLLALLGLWVIASPFVLENTRTLVTVINVGGGLAVVLLAGTQLYGMFALSE